MHVLSVKEKLLNISYPSCYCKSVSYNNLDHLKRSDEYYDNIMSILREATDVCSRQRLQTKNSDSSKNFNVIRG